VKEEVGKTLEEVAQGYLTELFRRSLVQVSSIRIDEKAKTCRVHDLIRLMILEKIEDLTFSHEISEDDHSSLSGIIRRLSIISNSNCLMEDIESSHVRSILVFTDYDSSKNFARKITTKCKLLKVLDFEAAKLHHVPKDIGKLIHLRYLSFKKNLEIKELPKSIGLLQNLETLDVRLTDVTDIPKEIGKLKKLRHLMGTRISLIQLKDGIGGLKSLQTLNNVWLDEDGAGKIIRELGKLKLLRDLRLFCVEVEHESDLSLSINQMQHLEKLVISFSVLNEVVDLHLISSLSTLQNLSLFVKLEKLPEWIPKLQNLVNLELSYSELIDDPLKSLQNMQNLLSLSIQRYGYNGESLHFQDGGFQKLKELKLDSMNYLNFILIDKGALCVLKRLELWDIPQLETAPTGIQHLEKLQVLSFGNMSTEFDESIAPLRGKEHWLIERRNA
jgi:disease resistance protein RPM1